LALSGSVALVEDVKQQQYGADEPDRGENKHRCSDSGWIYKIVLGE
jgi:hypothetical protein